MRVSSTGWIYLARACTDIYVIDFGKRLNTLGWPLLWHNVFWSRCAR